MARDDSILGNAVLDDWPTRPTPPFRIAYAWRMRDGGGPRGGTFAVMLEDGAGVQYPFFFDRFLGRLCYGQSEDDDRAAFLRRGSALEDEAFAAIEAAARADPDPEHAQVLPVLEHARRWAGPAGAVE